MMVLWLRVPSNALGARVGPAPRLCAQQVCLRMRAGWLAVTGKANTSFSMQCQQVQGVCGPCHVGCTLPQPTEPTDNMCPSWLLAAGC